MADDVWDAGQFVFDQMLLAVPLGMALGLGAMVVEIFPLRSRVTSMSPYSITLAISGGPPRSSSGWLIERFQQPLAPYYIMLYAAIGLAVIWPMQETNARRLGE